MQVTKKRLWMAGLSSAAAIMSALAVSSPAAADGPSISSLTVARAVYASFEQEPTGAYSVDVGARTDVLRNETSAQTRGELHFGTDTLYYFAYGTGPNIRLRINANDSRASLHAVIPVQYCFDVNGDEVGDPRCPVGSKVTVDASFTSSGPLTYFYDPGNLVRGRVAEATAVQNGVSLGSAEYAEIVENLTVTPTQSFGLSRP